MKLKDPSLLLGKKSSSSNGTSGNINSYNKWISPAIAAKEEEEKLKRRKRKKKLTKRKWEGAVGVD